MNHCEVCGIEVSVEGEYLNSISGISGCKECVYSSPSGYVPFKLSLGAGKIANNPEIDKWLTDTQKAIQEDILKKTSTKELQILRKQVNTELVRRQRTLAPDKGGV